MDEIKLMEGAAPFFYPGNQVGCLLIHGLTGTPFEMRWLGQHLCEQGYTVHGPRLAGHGTTPADLAHATWREWYAGVLAGYQMLRAQCQKVFVMGLSMGGALALLLASREPVDGLVTMSALYRVRDWRRPLLPLIGLFRKTFPKGYDPAERAIFYERVAAEQARRGEPQTGHPSYPEWVVPAMGQLMKLLDELHSGIGNVTAPALLIHSTADRTVSFENLQLIHDAIGSREKQMLVLDRCGHVVTEDIEHQTVFEAVANFVTARS